MNQPQLIQPTGFHLCLSGDWLVNAVSANVGDFLPCTAETALGQPVTALLGDDAIHDIRNRMALLRTDEAVEHLLHVSLAEDGAPLDLSIFRDGNGYGIDAEPSDNHAFGDATAIVDGMVSRMSADGNVATIASEAARHLRALTGFDRVLIIGDGDLLGKSIRPGQADHPLEERPTRCGHLAVTDSIAPPVEILASTANKPSRSTLRVAADHEARCIDSQQARAALILPLLRAGQSWGQIACYHGSARHVGVERRSVASLFARFVALQLELAELRAR